MEDKKTKPRLSAKELSVIPIFAVLTAVFAQIAIPLPFTPVPISLAQVAVVMSGILLKPKHAAYSQICYLALGAVGVPVFGHFRGGVGALFGPTGGYLLVYPIMAWIVAMALNSQKSRQAERSHRQVVTFLKSAAAMCVSWVFLYLGGTIWLSVVSGTEFFATLGLAVFPFIPLDVIKILFCVFFLVPLRSRLLSTRLLMLDDRRADGVSA